MKQISELRQDIVTGDWVVVATGRARRSQDFVRKDGLTRAPKRGCPFEALLPEALLVFDAAGEPYRLTSKIRAELEKTWWLQVVPNKFPAFGRGSCQVLRKVGPYQAQDGVGFHEVVITRDHDRSPGMMNREELAILFKAYRARYLALKDEGCVEYISIFHNHGPEAGASLFHPHSQIIAIPVVPPDVGRSLRGSAAYFRAHGRCVHCAMIRFERRAGERVIFQNRAFIAFAPYISRTAFEIRIFPLRHNPEFESTGDEEISELAEVFKLILNRLYIRLKNPAYNFFIHTAPTSNGRNHHHYHWHIEILPKTAVWAGFEIGTGIEISTASPEAAARFLRVPRSGKI